MYMYSFSILLCIVSKFALICLSIKKSSLFFRIQVRLSNSFIELGLFDCAFSYILY